MTHRQRSRQSWWVFIAASIAVGIFSRIFHTGFVLVDKYLGDALYATMVYGILRLELKPRAAAIWAALVMAAIEIFQLTMIPARMLESEHLLTRICARLMGVEFSFRDLFAYGVGITSVYLVDSTQHTNGKADFNTERPRLEE